ncbi:unnamed protein product [Linum trigynum]|uniref:Uncharacterized protein n=1 Tax=Linum trigynum TaxID=586398 RepID=A0AAV2CIQ5_9ROSI
MTQIRGPYLEGRIVMSQFKYHIGKQGKEPLYISVHIAQLVRGILGKTPKSKTVRDWPKVDNIILMERPDFDKWYKSLVLVRGGGLQFHGTLIL